MHFDQNDTTLYIFPADTITSDTVGMIARDSIIIEPKQYQSLFQSDVSMELTEKPLISQDQPFWVPLLLLAGFILLAWGRLFFRRRLDMIFRSVFAKNYANQLIREGNLFNERIGLVLFLVYLGVIAMMVYQSLPLFNLEVPFPPILSYLMIVGFFFGLWVLKVVMVNVLSLLFNTAEQSRELLLNMYVFNLFAGIVLLPLVSCMAFAHLEVFFFISLIITTLIYILRIIRAIIIGITINKFSVFHLFMYLCTLEILPMIVLAKILTRNVIL